MPWLKTEPCLYSSNQHINTQMTVLRKGYLAEFYKFTICPDTCRELQTAEGTCVLGLRNSTPSWLMPTMHGEGQLRWLTFWAKKILAPNSGRVVRTSERSRSQRNTVIIIVIIRRGDGRRGEERRRRPPTNEFYFGILRTEGLHGS